jgi:ribose/xylose/arabinose/galactoside ABC-type transport system permease subunit
LLLLFVLGALAFPNFLTPLNLSAIAAQYSIIGLLALGQLLVILTEGIDLSQGSQVAFTACVIAVLMQVTSPPLAIAGGILANTLLGFTNGLLVSRTPIPAFIVTLGMLGIARGLALLVSNAEPVAIDAGAFTTFGRSKLLGVPVSFLIWLAVAGLIQYFLTQRRTGRHIYAVGGNEEGARLSGVNVQNTKLLVYTLAGFFTALGGAVWAARLRSGSPIGGVGYELESIAAVVVGGGSLFGGSGTVLGTVSGVLIFGVINSCLNLAGISPYWQGTIKGVLVLLAVMLGQLRRR